MKKLFILFAILAINPIGASAKTSSSLPDKQAIYTKNAPAPIGVYSQAIKIDNTIYISGQIPIDNKTGELVAGDFNQQFRQAITNLSEIAKAAGGNLDDIVKVTVYVTDLANFTAVNQIMTEYFHKPYPARVVVEIKDLPKHAPVEIEAIMEMKKKDLILMKVQLIKEFGAPSVFELVDIPQPILKQGHVLVKVYATSVNQIDCKIRSGAVSALAPDFPAILQGDLAGIVEAVAPDVTSFKVGDEIYGCAGGLKGSNGALAEYMLVDAKLIAMKPKSLSMLEAAALPLVSITAWEALFKKARLTSNHNILIHGGVGGVGHIAVQLAKWCGAKVYTTVLKDEDFSLAKSLGADEVINAKEEDVEEYVNRLTNGQGFDIVFDTVGGSNLDKSLIAAAINGSVVTTVARSTHDLTSMHNKALSLHVVFMLLPILQNQGREAHGKILAEVAKIVDENKLKPLIDVHKFTLETAQDAHALLESGKAQGKIVISIHKYSGDCP